MLARGMTGTLTLCSGVLKPVVVWSGPDSPDVAKRVSVQDINLKIRCDHSMSALSEGLV